MIIMIRVIKTGDNNEPAANNRNQRLTKSNLKLWPNKQKPHIEVLPPPFLIILSQQLPSHHGSLLERQHQRTEQRVLLHQTCGLEI